MCGRYASFRSAQDLADAFDVDQITDAAAAVAAGYNIAPTDPVRVVLERTDRGGAATGTGGRAHATNGAAENSRTPDTSDARKASGTHETGGTREARGTHETTGTHEASGHTDHDDASAHRSRAGSDTTSAGALVRAMHVARWGLIPGWAKDPRMGARMINARSESVADKPAFAKPFAQRRCIVVADGYYEWHTETSPSGGKPVKTPFYIHPSDGSPIAFAGLYSWWANPTKEPGDPDRWVLSTTIITQAARDGLEDIHDREPAVLDHEVISPWLDRGTTPNTALEILDHPSPALSWHEVDRAVGSVRNQGPHLIEPV